MYERSISCSIGWGVTRRGVSWASSGIVPPLDVQVHDFLRVLLDVLAPGLDRLSHEDGEERVRGQGVVDRDLLEEAPRGVHRCLPQLLGVHLSEPLIPLVRDALVPDLARDLLPLSLRVRVEGLLALPDLLQRRLRDVHVSGVDQGPHVAEEEGEQEGRDVLPVDVRIGHRDDLVVPDLREVELVADARANRGDERPDLLVLQHLVESGLLDVQDFPAQGQDRLELAPSPLLRRPPRARPLYDEKLRFRRVPFLAVRELAGEVEPFEESFAAREFPRLPGGLSRLRGQDGLPDADLRHLRGLHEEFAELLVDDRFDDPLDVGVPELHLRLPLELWLGHLEAQDRGQALPDIVPFEALALLQELVVLRVLDESPREARLESDEVGPTLDRVDVVHEREDRLVVAVVVLHRDLDVRAVRLLREPDWIRVERVLRPVDPLHVLRDPAVVLEDVPAAVDLVDDDDPQPAVQERELAEALGEGVVVELDGLEDLGVRTERDDRASAFGRADDLEVRRFLPAGEAHPILFGVAPHADLEPFAQAIHDGQADAVQAARHAVHLSLELPAAVHPRQDELDAGHAVLGMDVHRDSASVVRDGHGSIRVEGDLDVLAEPRHRLVDRVVDDLVDEVMEAARVDAPDVHRGAFSDRLQALKNLDLPGVVGGLFYHLIRNLPDPRFDGLLHPIRRMSGVCAAIL